MFAVIYLPQFALQSALRHTPELWTQPVALVDPALSTPRVCDVTAPARDRGVEPGLTPTQALARCREVLIRHRAPAREAAATEAALQCAYGFSPHLEHTAPGLITLDLRGLSELQPATPATPDGDSPRISPALQPWAARLRAALASQQLTARLGLGPTPNLARHAALWARPAQAASPGSTEAVCLVDDPRTFIAGLPLAALEPSTDTAGILAGWGLHTVGELLALGQDAVMDRLGLEAIALFAAASAQTLRPLHLVRPASRYEEVCDFEHPVETLEPLLFLLNRFILQICSRLELGRLAARQLTLRLQLESGERIERRLHIPQPTGRPDILLRMLETHLESLRAESPIVSLALEADPIEPAQRQFTLFEAALRDPHQFQETLARLSALVGADRVGTPIREASHRPDAFRLVPPDFENVPPAALQPTPALLRPLPLRRLRPAATATVTVSAPGATADPTDAAGPRDKARRRHPNAGRIVDLLGPLFRPNPNLNPGSTTAPGHSQDTASVSEPPTPPPSLTPPAAPDELPPLAIHCQIARGALTIALGPWRASGHWWEPGAWQRDEWDVQTADGQALRLVRRPASADPTSTSVTTPPGAADIWQVEGIVD